MKVYKHLITPYRDFTYSGPLDVSLFQYRPGYCVKSILSCSADATIYLAEDEEGKERLYADVVASANLLLIDSRTNEEYESPISIEDDVEILSSLLDEGEGYVFPENAFDLEVLVFAMLLSSLPLVSHKEDSPLPQGGEGYDVYQEGEEKTIEGFFEVDPEEGDSDDEQ